MAARAAWDQSRSHLRACPASYRAGGTQYCEHQWYPYGEVVTITATAGTGSTFIGWSGTCSGTGACQATMSEHREAIATFVSANQPPVANAGGPYSGVRGEPVAFNGTASSDPDGDPLTYAWTFGDGGTGTGPTPSHTYSALGTFTVTLIVSDGETSSPPGGTTVTITNVAPSVALTSPANGAVLVGPADVTVTAGASDPDGSVALVEFFAGGTKIGESASAPYGFVWPGVTPGVYVLMARATDDSGAVTNSTPVSFLVNAPPTVSFDAPAPGALFTAPATIAISASAADADGIRRPRRVLRGRCQPRRGPGRSLTATWSNAPAGLHQLTAVATDDRGATSTALVAVRVEARVAPTADSFVRDGTPGTNNGTKTVLEVRKASGNSNNRWTYLKFDTSVVASVSSVRLRLHGALSSTTGSVVRAQVLPVADTSWVENALTWNNRPPMGSPPLATVTIVNSTTLRWYEWDVTAYVQQEKAAGRHVITLGVQSETNINPTITFRSRQSSTNKPELVLTP